MSKIFLTSVGANVLNKIVDILNLNTKNLKVLFIPTAANLKDDKSFIIKDKDELKRLGFRIIEFDISNKSMGELKKAVKDIDILYVAGGNTFYLMQEIRNIGFDNILENLINSQIIYIGSSAGSAILCPTIKYLEKIDDPKMAPELKSFEGLNKVNFLLFPHYDSKELKDKFDIIKKEYKDYKILCITDKQFVFIHDTKFEVLTND